ncbi:MAG: BIG2 domain-containing protein [Shouchella clausii]|jgi:hypothetical protein
MKSSLKALTVSVILLLAGLVLGDDRMEAHELPLFHFEKTLIEPSEMRYNPTGEVDFPTVIRAADYFENPLGTYYMYYGPHDAPGGIALAYADSVTGPWTEYASNPVISRNWQPHYNVSHVASAHPIWNEEEGKLFLYFHGENSVTRLASSEDGIHFDYEQVVIDTSDFTGISEASYARVFEHELDGKDNRYVMLLMGNNNGTRRIYLAWSADGREWEAQQEPLISPQPGQGGNLSGAYYFPYNGHHYVTVHGGSGNQYVVDVGENFDQEIHLGAYYQPSAVAPENGRAASRSYIYSEDELYMVYEAGQRGSTKIALARAIIGDERVEMASASLRLPSRVVSSNSEIDFDVLAHRYDGTTIAENELSFSLFSSDSSIVRVDGQRLYSGVEGIAEVRAEVSYRGKVITTEAILLEVRDGKVWNVIDERFDDYTRRWQIAKGSAAQGTIEQGAGFVDIIENRRSGGAYHYLTYDGFYLPNSFYTLEAELSVFAPSQGNEISIREGNRQKSLFITYDGNQGFIQDRLLQPTVSVEIDPTEQARYKLVSTGQTTYDVYRNDEFLFRSTSVSQAGQNLVKVGADSQGSAALRVHALRIQTNTAP